MADLKVNILGHEYTVLERPQDDAMGSCDVYKLTIELAPELNPSHRGETLLHEILEALNYHMEWKLPHRTLNQIALTLKATLKGNPQVTHEVLQ